VYEVVVVGTDGSERADVAVKQALSWAKQFGATLHMVHVVRPGAASELADSLQTQVQVSGMREEKDNVTAQLLADAEADGVSVEVRTPSGDPADAILGAAKSLSADLIVVGNRGMSGVKRFVLGSVPNKIAHQSDCSVLIVDTDTA
jgi:nucleotide-binding universal stress UspA family protein